MGITIRKAQLEARLEDAVRLAESPARLSDEWTKRTEHISQCPSETYIAALGVALLAKATEPAVDVLTIKASAGPNAYSMRGVANVLVSRARHYGYHLGVTGPEPLNNQPWFSNDRIDRISRIGKEVVPFHQALVRYLRDLQKVDEHEAQQALAAFLRLRLSVGIAAKKLRVVITNAGEALDDVLRLAETFIRQDPEGGKRGQAVVAALLSCVHEHVQTGAINNPRAFDVRVDSGESPLLAVEVKQKPVGEEQILYLAAEAADAGFDKALYAALGADQAPVDAVSLRERAATDHGVLLGIGLGITAVADLTFLGSAVRAEDLAAALPGKVLQRLIELRVSSEGQAHWSGLFLRA
jgi:SacI restriction endonuclease